MGWDNEFFVQKKNIFVKQTESDGNIASEKKIKRCSNCNQPIGTVSTTLYEIDEKNYCSDCYSQTIVSHAIARDHIDLKREKTELKQATT